MKICVIGTGYVGLVTGVCFADLGNIVHCVDTDVYKIKKLNYGSVPIFEPGLEELVKKCYEDKRLIYPMTFYNLKRSKLTSSGGILRFVVLTALSVCGEEFKLVVPGIRPTWARSDDQKRVLTPGEAVARGADYLVIGRPISRAADPAAAARRISAEIAEATVLA